MSIASSHSLTVIGKAKAQGSLRSFKHPKTGAVITPQDTKVVSYRGSIVDEWYSKYMGPDLREGSVSATLVFAFRRPDNHYWPKTKSRSHREVLRDEAPDSHTGTPDIDKLARSVLDALTGLAYEDDKQVSSLHALKLWAGEDTTTIILKGGA